MSLTPIQHLAIRYLAAGWSMPKTAAELKLEVGVVRRWHRDVSFIDGLRAATQAHGDMIEAVLLAGEREAAVTMIAAMGAEKKPGIPDWNTRLTAAMSLMDRAGKRGKAIDKQQIAQVVTNVKAPEEIEHALRNALRDPGVREWLRESGAVAALLSGTGEPEEAEVIIALPDDLTVDEEVA